MEIRNHLRKCKKCNTIFVGVVCPTCHAINENKKGIALNLRKNIRKAEFKNINLVKVREIDQQINNEKVERWSAKNSGVQNEDKI